jgi:L,D-peptidoglycan transpeptidase YkuD (ErfK/YbiS/YcfS/YnhG family)
MTTVVRTVLALAVAAALLAGCAASPPAQQAAATTPSTSATPEPPASTLTPTPSPLAAGPTAARPTTSPSARPSAPPTGTAPVAGQPLPFPVPVTIGSATQVITVQASGSWASVVAWQRDATGWHRVLATAAARVGANGVTNGSTRRQGTNTTPTGTYTLTQAFGILANPGARLPYHRVGPDDWWVEDNNSRWYNTLRQASAGGFDTALPESDVNGSEHLIRHTGQYDYAVVIDYNMHPAVPYRGAGIFLHVSDGYPTAGCVAVPRATLVAMLRWLDPGRHPRIAIG